MRDNFNTDYVHDCTYGDVETLRKEDVLILGNATDFDGTTTIAPQAVMRQGIANTQWGTTGYIEDGAKEEDLNDRGMPVSRYRERTRHTYIDKSKEE